MSEVVERVKKAILEAADEAAQLEGEYCSPAMAEAAARAAIEAVREPTEAMIMAVRPQGLSPYEVQIALMGWKAMFDELLRD